MPPIQEPSSSSLQSNTNSKSNTNMNMNMNTPIRGAGLKRKRPTGIAFSAAVTATATSTSTSANGVGPSLVDTKVVHPTLTPTLAPIRFSKLSKNTLMHAANKKHKRIATTGTATPTASASINPQCCLAKLLEGKGIKATIHSADSLVDFFQETKQEEVDAYGFDVLKAVRESDLPALRQFHSEGRPLKCSNRFGESLLHLACRKALVSVVDFFINEIQIPLAVKDDMGRSPLSDAFWTAEPNTELVDILLKKCPDLLLVSDKRGHTPLAYARQEHWSTWNDYLVRRSDWVTPTLLNR